MFTQHSLRARASCLTGLLLLAVSETAAARATDEQDARDVVAVAVLDSGRAIVLATPGLSHQGRHWRFRSFDTSELPQPISDAVLSVSGTKLFIQTAATHGGVLDLTRQDRHNAALQYVAAADLATGAESPRPSHRLPEQRFVSVRNDTTLVIDDVGRVLAEYSTPAAVRAAISRDGVVTYVDAQGSRAICGETGSTPGTCRVLGPTTNVDAQRDGPAESPTGGVASLRTALALSGRSIPEAAAARLVDSLVRESARTSAAAGQPIQEWQFFPVSVDANLYAPVLQFAASETVFPASFDVLESLSRRVPKGARPPSVQALYDRYRRLDRAGRLQNCTMYFHTLSTEGSWIVEYWLYYPFDVGGLVSHPHDPEHLFVEVDKLGGAPRRVIGAGHGYMAGNNIYSADKPGAAALRLPLFALVELGKHATAPDVDRDGQFTPGVDENEYHERAKIWGVRDVIGTINNELLAYDRTMTVGRRPQDSVSLASAKAVFPDDPDLVGRASCRLEALTAPAVASSRGTFRLSDWILLPPCDGLTTDCAKRHVTSHPDFLDFRTVLKEWAFPASFLRTTYGVGPRRGFHTIGLGYAMDLDHLPAVGRYLPLPGRLGIDAFYWRQHLDDPDENSCLSACKRTDGVGWGLRYEQFLSNLFGIYTATRVYTAPLSDLWITFGPFVEAPIGRRSNVSVEGGLSFRPTESPRFEFRVSVGLWKPKTGYAGVHADE